MNVASLITRIQKRLREAGVPSPEADAEIIIAHVLGILRARLYLEARREVLPREEVAVSALVESRRERVPLQYLLGECEFMSLPFRLQRGVFIPRPETEVLVEALIKRVPRGIRPARFLDLGTGSGVIAVSLAKYLEPDLVIGCDISLDAVRIATENAMMNGVASNTAFVVGGGVDFLGVGPEDTGRFDVVACNPPYIESDAIKGLEPEVRDHEPRVAIDGGPDGFRFIERIAPQAASMMKGGGLLALEIGAGQGALTEMLLLECGLGKVEVLKDLNGLDRVVIGRKSDG